MKNDRKIYQFKNELVWHSGFHTFFPLIQHLWLHLWPQHVPRLSQVTCSSEAT